MKTPSDDGFFHCDRCNKVVEPSHNDVEAAQSAPGGKLVGIKCPICHKFTVRWQLPSVRKPKPEPQCVEMELGLELFKKMYPH